MKTDIQNQIKFREDTLEILGYYTCPEEMTHITTDRDIKRHVIASFKDVPSAKDIFDACKDHDQSSIKIEGYPNGYIYLFKYLPMTTEEIAEADLILRQKQFKIWKQKYRVHNNELNYLKKKLEEL